MIFKEFRWMNFSEIVPAYAPEIEISKNYWMSFPEIGLCHAPEFFEYHFSTKCSILDEFSRMPQNSKIVDWMSFPVIGLAHAPEICQ